MLDDLLFVPSGTSCIDFLLLPIFIIANDRTTAIQSILKSFKGIRRCPSHYVVSRQEAGLAYLTTFFVHCLSASNIMSMVTICTCISCHPCSDPVLLTLGSQSRRHSHHDGTLMSQKASLGIPLVYLGRGGGFRITNLPSWNV